MIVINTSTHQTC